MKKLLDLGSVAEILGISRATAKIWASKRKFPVVKVGRLVRVSPEALEAWIRGNTSERRERSSSNSRKGAPARSGPGSFANTLEEMLKDEAKRTGNRGSPP